MDKVDELGYFLEIEIVITNEEEMIQSKDFMKELLYQLEITDLEKIDCGYRELMMKHNSKNKDLEYYLKEQKVYWVVNQNINENIKANDIVPCIFVETKNNKMYMLQLDLDIKLDDHKYTAWRKLIGTIYGIKVEVLLIYEDVLYTLNNRKISFNDIGRSNTYVDKQYLAKFDTIYK